MSEKCPKCGAEIDEDYTHLKTYKCGAFYKDGKLWRSRPECYERELAQLQARNEKLEKVAEATNRYFDLEPGDTVYVKTKCDLYDALIALEAPNV